MRQCLSFRTGFAGLLALAILGVTDRSLESAKIETTVAKADFHVATDGKDTNPGTAEKPFATLARACGAVRKKIAAGLRADMLVLIRGGTYRQTETLAFGPEDSGTDKHSVTYAAYPGEKVLLSGGRQITGWKKGDGKIWTAEIFEVKAGKWYFRQLFVDGQRATRARMPNRNDDKPWWNIVSSSIERHPTGSRLPIPPPEGKPIILGVSGPIKAWNNVSDVELVWIHNHTGSRKRLAGVDEASQTFVLQPPHIMAVPAEAWSPGAQHGLPSVEKACYLENALEFLTQAGEWYLDRKSGVLYYWPRPGEDLTRDEVVAPKVQKAMIIVTGRRDRPVRNLHFDGIHLEYVDCPLPDEGYFIGWLGQRFKPYEPTSLRFGWIDAAVQFEHARDCSFSDGGIAHVGGMGITAYDGTADIAIEGNDIHDLGSGGIGMGTSRCKNITHKPYASVGPIPREDEYRGYRIANNHIHHCGADYLDAVGIVANTVHETVITHNLIHDVGYSGLVIEGNIPNDDPALAGDNRIEYNHIYNVMKVCNDGAAIYVVMPQARRGVVIRGNLVHDSQRNPYNGRTGHSFGIYLDVIAENYHILNNISYRCADSSLYFVGDRHKDKNHKMWKDNTWGGNVFQNIGTPPPEAIEAIQVCAGLEPPYRLALLKTKTPTYTRELLGPGEPAKEGWSGCQFNCAEAGKGIVQILHEPESADHAARFKLRGLIATAFYELKAWAGPTDGPVSLVPDIESLFGEGAKRMTGQQLMEQGLPVKLPQPFEVAWISYQRK
ncbi:MAG: right-handed parallel beta-helix repeat-containing protein [Pirellulales bacterium]|nr:right-handed parallel beta-helix repeat-containing protein [Pirellulales bacterium]